MDCNRYYNDCGGLRLLSTNTNINIMKATELRLNKQWYPILDSSDTSYKITPTISVSKNYKTK